MVHILQDMEHQQEANINDTNGVYNTSLGKDASTTKNIYGIYDMSGGAYEYVMGVYNKAIGYSRF